MPWEMRRRGRLRLMRSLAARAVVDRGAITTCDEQKVLLLKRGGTLSLSSLHYSVHVAFAIASLQP